MEHDKAKLEQALRNYLIQIAYETTETTKENRDLSKTFTWTIKFLPQITDIIIKLLTIFTKNLDNVQEKQTPSNQNDNR